MDIKFVGNVEGSPVAYMGGSREVPAGARVPPGIYCFSTEKAQKWSGLTKQAVSTLSQPGLLACNVLWVSVNLTLWSRYLLPALQKDKMIWTTARRGRVTATTAINMVEHVLCATGSIVCFRRVSAPTGHSMPLCPLKMRPPEKTEGL